MLRYQDIHQRLELLKNSILELKDVDASIPDFINSLNPIWYRISVSEIWSFIFQGELFILYKALSQKSLFPTPPEMNEIHKFGSAWFWLVKAVMSSNKFFSIFQDLINKNILPNSAALSVKTKLTCKNNAWDVLTERDKGMAIFQYLLNKGILPSSAALSDCWSLLALSEAGKPILQDLLNKSILPDSVALSKFWLYLAMSDKGIPIFQDLLNKGILPNSAVLSARFSSVFGYTVWDCLAMSDIGFATFQHLVNKDILPSYSVLDSTLTDLEKRKSLFDTVTPIIKRLKNIQNLKNKYNISTENQMSKLLSHVDIENFYGWIYLFYCYSINRIPLLITLNVPVDIVLKIGSYLLPEYATDAINDFANCIKKPENWNTFLKHYMIDYLESYTSGFFKVPHENRAKSLKEAIKNSENPGPILFNQHRMSRRAKKTPYIEINFYHQKPFGDNIQNEMLGGKFYEFLREASLYKNDPPLKKT